MSGSDVAEALTWFRERVNVIGPQDRDDSDWARHAAVLVRAALASSPPAGDTTTETRTEYRITSRTPNGLGRRLSCGSSLGRARERAAVLQAEGSTEVTVESRTVLTTRTESRWEEER